MNPLKSLYFMYRLLGSISALVEAGGVHRRWLPTRRHSPGSPRPGTLTVMYGRRAGVGTVTCLPRGPDDGTKKRRRAFDPALARAPDDERGKLVVSLRGESLTSCGYT